MPLTVKRFSTVNARQQPTAMALMCNSGIPGRTNCVSAPMPISANALLKLIENQFARPLNVPAKAPKLRSM